jgi:uncharacterized protein with HEPN domain
MNQRDLGLLSDILEFTDRSVRLVAGREFDAFVEDEAARFAVRYCFIVIGEASRRLSNDARDELPATPWRDIFGMRNQLAHGYESVRDQIVHRTVVEDLPAFARSIRDLLPKSGALGD